MRAYLLIMFTRNKFELLTGLKFNPSTLSTLNYHAIYSTWHVSRRFKTKLYRNTLPKRPGAIYRGSRYSAHGLFFIPICVYALGHSAIWDKNG